MDSRQFDDLVARLERLAQDDPRAYRQQVAGIAALGFLILGLVVGIALINVALLVGLVAVVVVTGGKALVVVAKLGKLLIILALPAWTMLRSTATLLFARFPRPQGRDLRREEAPALFARLDALRRRFHGPKLHRVVLTDEINAAIVQHPRFGLFGWEENTLILGLRLLRAMSEEEAMAVVAHEYGHLSGYHSRYAGLIYRFRAAWGRLQELSQRWDDWGSRLVARLFRWYAPRFSAYTFALARQNEYAADRAAAEFVGAEVAANALMRAGITARFEEQGFWPVLSERLVREPLPPADRSAIWAEALHKGLGAEQRLQYLQQAGAIQTDALDTHPALRDRLAAMGIAADADHAARLESPPCSAAEAWFGSGLAALCAEFDRDWQTEISPRWQERHAHLRRLAERVAELDARSELDAEQQWEYLLAVEELEPKKDLRPLLERLLATAPEHLAARFRLACLQLEAGDESGVDALESVMAADPSATLAGCAAIIRFYATRGSEDEAKKAEPYRARWEARSAYETAVRSELATLPRNATLAPAELSQEVVDAVREVLRANRKHLSRAYLLRRILKSDPSLSDHVLAFETSRFTFGDKNPATLKRLAALEWPLHLFIVALGAKSNRQFRKSIRKQKIAALDF